MIEDRKGEAVKSDVWSAQGVTHERTQCIKCLTRMWFSTTQNETQLNPSLTCSHMNNARTFINIKNWQTLRLHAGLRKKIQWRPPAAIEDGERQRAREHDISILGLMSAISNETSIRRVGALSCRRHVLSSGEAELYPITEVAAHILGIISMAADYGRAMSANALTDSTTVRGSCPGQVLAESDKFESSSCDSKRKYRIKNWSLRRWVRMNMCRAFEKKSQHISLSTLASAELTVDQICLRVGG